MHRHMHMHIIVQPESLLVYNVGSSKYRKVYFQNLAYKHAYTELVNIWILDDIPRNFVYLPVSRGIFD